MTIDHELRTATLARLGLLDDQLRTAVASVQAESSGPWPIRGLYITDDDATELASGPRDDTATAIFGPPDEVLVEWGRHLGIDAVDVDLLIVAAAPDIDRRYEQLYGYLHDDITRRRATVGLALRLAGHDVRDPVARRRLLADAALASLALVEIEEGDRPFLTRSLRVPDRVVMAMLGDDLPVSTVTLVRVADVVNEWVGRLARSFGNSRPLFVHVRDRPERTAAALAAAALVETHGEAVHIRLQDGVSSWPSVLDDAVREAVLRGCGLVVEAVDDVVGSEPRTIERLAELPRPVVLTSRRDWDPDWADSVPLSLDAPALDALEQLSGWRQAIGPSGHLLDVQSAVGAFRLGPDRIRRAADAAHLASFHRGDDVRADDLQWGARQQNGSGLRRLARRIVPEADWGDLVLEPEVLRSVREVVSRVRHRSFVLGEWRLRRGGGRGDGITAMFAGPSGTGKTLAAEVIAGELGVDLHTVDLATVVDKYIGETEKNLDRIFDEAEQVNTVLFFDEADALFGKRSEVKDARDRYANVEVAYLLQRMERFNGAAILATNLKLNIDEAFARRLDLIVEFEKPTATERRHLWQVIAGRDLPLAADVDFDLLGDSFDLAGGDIRNAVTTAAYLAADRGGEVEMTDCVRAVAREYRKLGRLCLPHEFGDWFDVLDPGVVEASV